MGRFAAEVSLFFVTYWNGKVAHALLHYSLLSWRDIRGRGGSLTLPSTMALSVHIFV